MNWFHRNRSLAGLFSQDCLHGLYHCRVSHRLFFKHISRKLLDIMMGFAAGLIAASFGRLQPSIGVCGKLLWEPGIGYRLRSVF